MSTAYSLAKEAELEIARIIGDYEAGKFRIPIVKTLIPFFERALAADPVRAALVEAQKRIAELESLPKEWEGSGYNPQQCGRIILLYQEIQVRLKNLLVALKEIRAVASGEQQVADDDTEGMQWIVERVEAALKLAEEHNAVTARSLCPSTIAWCVDRLKDRGWITEAQALEKLAEGKE